MKNLLNGVGPCVINFKMQVDIPFLKKKKKKKKDTRIERESRYFSPSLFNIEIFLIRL